jgi:ABC-type cobalamin/Fe3+-siderophores transport system ATPase subunit
MTLHAASVSFSYGAHEVLRDLDCELAQGRITAIVGANASGKSTLQGRRDDYARDARFAWPAP